MLSHSTVPPCLRPAPSLVSSVTGGPVPLVAGRSGVVRPVCPQDARTICVPLCAAFAVSSPSSHLTGKSVSPRGENVKWRFLPREKGRPQAPLPFSSKRAVTAVFAVKQKPVRVVDARVLQHLLIARNPFFPVHPIRYPSRRETDPESSLSVPRHVIVFHVFNFIRGIQADACGDKPEVRLRGLVTA